MITTTKPDPASILMAESWTLFNRGHHLPAIATARMTFESVLRNALDKSWSRKNKSGAVQLARFAFECGRLSIAGQRDVDNICGRLSEVIHGRETTVAHMEGLLTLAEGAMRRMVGDLKTPRREVAHV
ncbi:MAG TPA: hypothetical protein VFG14_12805 [Chthoniobacteraceae bacterium]|nr:hypothetical protein [Chthoniobacteraceae bacterium]